MNKKKLLFSINSVTLTFMGFMEDYNDKHQHPVNRALHTIGIPTVVLSLFAFIYSWKLGLALFIVGWIIQFAGHVFEGKPPAFFSDPRFLLVGVGWWAKKIKKFFIK